MDDQHEYETSWGTWIEYNGKAVFATVVVVGTGVLVLLGSPMIINAGVLGGLTTVGGVLLYLRLPQWLRDLIKRWSVVLDAIIAIGVYFAFGETATALLAASITGSLTSAIFWVLRESEKLKEAWDAPFEVEAC